MINEKTSVNENNSSRKESETSLRKESETSVSQGKKKNLFNKT